uniref:Uncharacterized protein n=1 Tax=Anguilla anguilla TaxID=7936 RepID=A0A0E9XX15_ANGAN
MYSAIRKYSDPFTFSTFVTLHTYNNRLSSFLFSSIYTQYSIMTKQKQA